MSSTRRQLGTGPSTTRSTEPTVFSPRLLPVERVEPAALLADGEHQDVAEPNGRRILGTAPSGCRRRASWAGRELPACPVGPRLSAKTLFGLRRGRPESAPAPTCTGSPSSWEEKPPAREEHRPVVEESRSR
ncbi:hypothetical protein ACR6C2_00755 [Streptomyces sp. INA 01156]